MLDALRKQTNSWIAQIFIGLLVLSFAVWGVSGFFTGFYGDVVATVGKTEVSTLSFARQYDQAMQAMGRQTGRPLTQDQAQLFGLPSQVLGRLVTQATLDDTARQYGLGISDEVLAQKIAEDPAFRGPSGNFERLYFQQVLRNNGYTEDQYINDQQAVFLRFQISNALVNGAHAPEPYLRALHEYRFEERSIEYLVLSPDRADEVGEPGETELIAYFEENKSQWRAPQYRGLSLFTVQPEDIAEPEEITDEEAKTAYDRQISQYTKPERRQVSQILFNNGDEASAAAAAIADGKSFDEVASERELSASDTDLGLVTRDDIIDPKIAEAAFTLESGTTSAAVEGDFGWVILRVGSIEPGQVETFDEVKEAIKEQVAVTLAKRRIIETFDEVEDSRAAGDTLAEIANKIGAPLVTVDAVDQSGNGVDGNRAANLPTAPRLLESAFASDVGVENDAVRTEEGGYVWYEVTSDTTERDRDLDEVRDKVIEAWKRTQIDEQLTAQADKIRERLEAGESIEKLAEELTLDVKTALNLTRTSQPPVDLTASAVTATFNGPTGYVAIVDGAGDTGSKAVLVVETAFVPPFNESGPAIAQARDQISNQIANDYLQQFIVEKQDTLGVQVNQVALQSVVAGPTNSGY